MDTAAPALRRLEAVETGAKTVCGITHARGKEGASRPNGGQHPWPQAHQPQPGPQLRPSRRLLRRARASPSGYELTAQPTEPPCTDPYARWCDRESPRRPTYVDSVTSHGNTSLYRKSNSHCYLTFVRTTRMVRATPRALSQRLVSSAPASSFSPACPTWPLGPRSRLRF